MYKTIPKEKKQSGTSITEAIVFLSLLVPLCLLIPKLAKIGDFKMQTPQATRYLGWQEVITQQPMSATASRLHIQERVLKKGNLLIKSNFSQTGREYQTQFWNDIHNEQLQVFNANSTDLAVYRSTESDQTLTHKIMTGTNRLFQSVLSLGALDEFNTRDSGLITHAIHYSIGNLGLKFNCTTADNDHNLCLKMQHTIYYSGLAGRSSNDIINQVNTLKPFSMWEFIADPMASIAQYSLIFTEGAELEGSTHHVAPDIIPDAYLSN